MATLQGEDKSLGDNLEDGARGQDIGKMTIERERIIVDICVVHLKLIKNKIKNPRWGKKRL